MGFCRLQVVFSVFFGSSRSTALSPVGPAYRKAGREQAALLKVQNTPSPSTCLLCAAACAGKNKPMAQMLSLYKLRIPAICVCGTAVLRSVYSFLFVRNI